jgi:hypothetical protein
MFNPNRIPGNGIVTGNLGADLRRSLGEAISPIFSPRVWKGGALARISHHGFGRAGL